MIIQKKNEQFGITLIALAVTIIVMLILAGVTIATLTGEGGIISRAREDSFRTEMTEMEEKVNVLNTQVYLEGRVITDIFTEQVKIEDVKKWDDQLKFEVIYWGEYDIGVNTISRKYVKNNWKSIFSQGQNGKEYVDNLYYIDKTTSNGKEKVYLYDSRVGMIYKVKTTQIGKYKVNSLKELDYQKANDRDERDVLQGTLIAEDSTIKKIGSVSCYEPDLSGFVKEKTNMG